MPALLALIPVKDWIYAGLGVALLAFGGYEIHHLKAEGAAHEVAALQKSSAELTAKAVAHNAEIGKAYVASAAKITGDLNAQIDIANAQHTSDAQRLRDYDTYRRQHPAVASTGSPGGAPVAGTSSAGQGEDFVSELGLAGVSLADSLRDVNAALSACTADRNSLTGKP